MPPAATTDVPVTGVMGCDWIDLSAIGMMLTLRISWNVQPVSS